MSAPSDFDAEAYALGLGMSLGVMPGTSKSAELIAAVADIFDKGIARGAADERARIGNFINGETYRVIDGELMRVVPGTPFPALEIDPDADRQVDRILAKARGTGKGGDK
jgi:hypothetical protein